MKRLAEAGRVRAIATVLVVAAIAFVAGRLLAPEPHTHSHGDHGGNESAVETTYTCSMHPQIRHPGPGKCPICGMDLIPVADDSEDGDSGEAVRLELSPAAAARMQVETVPVTRRPVDHVVRLSGRIDFDETRLHSVVVRAEGEVRRLFLDHRFAPVRRGEHLAEIYSPQVHNAFMELVIARSSGGGLVGQARKKLELLGVSAVEIARVERTGKVPETFTLYSPADGVLGELNVRRGQWIGRGEVIMRIADLSEVWAVLSAYESDLPWLRRGQRVELSMESLPGATIEGSVSYIEPVVDETSRTAKVRVQLTNGDGNLKPGMFVRGNVHAAVNAGGDATPSELAGKWLCPMHPDDASDRPGRCSRCGMKREPADSLYRAPPALAEAPLLIPSTAPLLTGRRALVYVQVPGNRPAFEPREVVLGPRAGDFYVVREGLSEGDLVVSHGAFRIDSELQIRGRPSMMAPASADAHGHDHGHEHPVEVVERIKIPEAAVAAVGDVFRGYLRVSEALAADDLSAATTAAESAKASVSALTTEALGEEAGALWTKKRDEIDSALTRLASASSFDAARAALEPLSNAMVVVLQAFGSGDAGAVRKAHCPMAFDDRGADWLQVGDEVANPYFGASMLRCGDLEETEAQ